MLEVVGQLEARTDVEITDQATLEVWFLIRSEHNGEAVEGWAPSRVIQVFGESETGRIDRGNTGEFTTNFITRMLNDRFFWPAFLMVLIIPVQFVLAIVMALIIQARLKGNTFFPYIFTIPLGISELTVGILWFSIFTQSGFINSFLQSLNLIESPFTFLSVDSRGWILVAIWLAEVWRATSIVILEEAAQVFGCTRLQAFRHVVVPLVVPGITAAGIFTFVLSWNEVFAASILTVQNRTLPAQVLAALGESSEPYQFAGGFFMMIPALIFIYFIRGYLFNMWGQVSK